MELIVMEWLNQMNTALAYLEAHLEDDLDYNRMAQLAGCSPITFSGFFLIWPVCHYPNICAVAG